MSAVTTRLTEFPGLSHHAFQHPLDSQALAALKKVPALPTVLKYISEKLGERFHHAQLMSTNLRVDARQYPSLHKKFVRMAQVLGVRKLPSLFIETTPNINAYAAGMENYSIVLCSGLLDVMEDDELLAILGHELGHVKCEHMLYKTLGHNLATGGAALLAEIPMLGSTVAAGVGLALYEWGRKAELSCDRAALLATQDVDVVSSALAKLGGFSKRYAAELDLDAVAEQADEYDRMGQASLLVNLVMLSNLLSTTHPYPVVRVREIRRWAASPDYAAIIGGRYQRDSDKLAASRWAGVDIGTRRLRYCTGCDYPCNDDFAFCPNCQTNVSAQSLNCTACKRGVDAGWAHCMNCGVTLKSA